MIPSVGHAGVAKLAYAQDLKSCGPKGPYGFDPRLLHQDFRPSFSPVHCAAYEVRAEGKDWSGSDQKVIDEDRCIDGNGLKGLDIALQSRSLLAAHMNDFDGDPMVLNLPDLS